MSLTDTAVRNAKPTGKAIKLTDSGGLYLYVSPTGGRLWRMDYRHLGKRQTASFGAYPAVGLADARRRRDELKQQLEQGIDPAAAKRAAELAERHSAANTFEVIADEYLAKLAREGRADTTMNKVTWLLDFARPALGRRPITQISAAEVLEVLRKVESRGRFETAKRLRSTIGSVFRYAVATSRADNDPTFALQGALASPPPKPRAAVTDPKAFGGLLRAIDAFDGQATTHAALKLMAVLFPRPGELRMAEWAEFDLAKAIWTVPEKRMKMRRPHRVPLPTQAVTTLTELQKATGNGKLLFPSVRTVRRPISENTLNAALRRLGYDKDQATAHGFRATASTLLNESGLWNPDAIERQLAHIENNDVRRAYARGEHWDERVRMMQWWADRLDDLRAAV
ncbi:MULTISPECIES: integrase arm-type DNA-binding domain-containing protein [unclassified Chelatococcus]|uniref:tyrosine-type recombinase/integrase n=1 Tax=unclassified Chelatococcus TaxID=2638111 RepID=UPI001BCFF2CC|nr:MULTISPECIES: integrase arm-type DNA-binding domain-containing protein [unclassified Chelatococcus]MBS7698669.1 integrase arm-type DNA-binding domain-containing protein [Chelatococcus sp. YT9]MBX3554749.1 integrase arm-type DNA-binding domain-containing protein [Chelatococcus sp.]